jgi:hypothetical protein
MGASKRFLAAVVQYWATIVTFYEKYGRLSMYLSSFILPFMFDLLSMRKSVIEVHDERGSGREAVQEDAAKTLTGNGGPHSHRQFVPATLAHDDT